MNNCIVFFNTSDEDPASGTFNHSECSFNHSCSLPLPFGSGNIDGDPGFVDKDANDLRLKRDVLATSPCINTGDNDSAPFGLSAVRCVYLGAGATLNGFTLSNGATLANQVGPYFFEAAGAGGAFCEARAVLKNCIISGNWGVSPGGVYSETLNNCLLINNHATAWGGGARSSIRNNCLLYGNVADLAGGGAYQGEMNNTTVTDNSALESNGGYSQWATAITNGVTGHNDSAAEDGVPNIVNYAIVSVEDSGAGSATRFYRLRVTGP